jgi:DNA primase
LGDERDAIRQRIDIVDLVSQRVRLKRSGKNYSGLCPFHDDKNPSFFVTPEIGRYQCYSCGEKGDIFTWVMKTQGLEFREALEQLAKQAGVTLSKFSGGEKVDRSEREKQLSMMESALIFFRSEGTKSEQTKKYLDSRKLPPDAIEFWELGFAPENGEALVTSFKRQGLSLATAKELFLSDSDSSGGYFDKFRNRLMFPIRDEKGALVGFGGRILGEGNPKYINSGDTPLYNKSRILYGMHRAKDRMIKERKAVLVEGYMDVIACHRAGVTEAVASCGTALAIEQAKLIKRFADRVTICYDADNAGQKAALRAVEVFREVGLICRVAMMPQGEDPDTLLNSKGPEAVREAIEHSQSPFDFEVWLLEKRLGVDSAEFWEELPKLLSKAETELDLEKHLLRLAGQHPSIQNSTAVTNALRREVKLQKRGQVKQRAASVHAPKLEFSQLLPAEVAIFKALLDERFKRSYWRFLSETELFQSALAERLRSRLVEVFQDSPPSENPSVWLHKLENEELIQSFTDLALDVRVQVLTESYLIESIESLRKQAESNRLSRSRPSTGEVEDADLAKYLEKLRRHKGIDAERED